MLVRTIHSEKQLSIHGAVSSWCKEFAQRTPNQKESIVEKFAAKRNEQLLEETHGKFRRMQCRIIRRSYASLNKGSEMTFLPVNISEDILLKPKSQNWSRVWCVPMVYTKGKQTAILIGNQWVQKCEKRFRRLEAKKSRTLIGHIIFTEEATKRGSSIARIPETSYCIFVLVKDTMVGT